MFNKSRLFASVKVSSKIFPLASVTEPWVLELCQKSQEEIDGDMHRRERLAEQDKQIADLQKQVAELSEKLSVLSKL